IHYQGGENIIENNYIEGAGLYGIFALPSEAKNITIQNNLIVDTEGERAIYVRSTKNVYIEHNKIINVFDMYSSDPQPLGIAVSAPSGDVLETIIIRENQIISSVKLLRAIHLFSTPRESESIDVSQNRINGALTGIHNSTTSENQPGLLKA